MLKNIEIIDYKCFKDFKLDGLSQINIISGGNNVGKTALLEVLFVENHINKSIPFPEFISPFIKISKNRDVNDNKLEKYLKNIKYLIKKDNHSIKIEYKNKNSLNNNEKDLVNKLNQDYEDFIVLNFKNKNLLSLKPINNINIQNLQTNYINSSKPTNKELVRLYSEIQTKGIQHKFLEYLQILDKNIALLEPQLLDDELLLRVNLKNPEISLISSELGEGTNRYMEILATLLSNSNGSIFIDEIENGIHYSKLKEICKAIIEIVQKENIQLFVTTHDKETIEAFSEACEEVGYKDMSSVELYKDEQNNIESIVRNNKQFIATVDSGMDIR